ncbi:MAG: hypothetical protein AB1646_17030 [Thermodesulfobacteriota bacterium]
MESQRGLTPTQTVESRSDETPASLTHLFPNDPRNLDDLFPEAKFRELFHDVATGLADVDSFVRRIDHELTMEKKSGTFRGIQTARRPGPSRSKGRCGAQSWKQT